MKIFTGIIVGAFCLLTISPSFAQKEKDEDVKITIDWDGEDVDLEEFFESLGESIELAFSDVEDADVSISFDDESFEEAMEKFGESMEKFGEGVEKAVKNMKIEMHNVDVDDLKKGDSNFNGNDMDDVIEEIEDEYNSEIENIDRMLIKLNEDYLDLEFDLTFKNGKEVRNLRKRLDNTH